MLYDLYTSFASSYLHGMLATFLLCYLFYTGLKQQKAADACYTLAKNYGGAFSADLGDLDEVTAIRRRQQLIYGSSLMAGMMGLIFALPLLPAPIYPLALGTALLLSAATQGVLQFAALRTRCYTGI